MAFVPSEQIGRHAEEGADADRCQQRRDDRHDGGERQAPLALHHVELLCSNKRKSVHLIAHWTAHSIIFDKP